jgi:hypothetical protein
VAAYLGTIRSATETVFAAINLLSKEKLLAHIP